MRDSIYHMITEYVENMVDRYAPADQSSEEWDIAGIDMVLHGRSR